MACSSKADIGYEGIQEKVFHSILQKDFALPIETRDELNVTKISHNHCDRYHADAVNKPVRKIQNIQSHHDHVRIEMVDKSLYETVDTTTYLALPVGMEFTYAVDVYSSLFMQLGASLHYAPETLSLDDADHYFAQRVKVVYRFMERGRVIAGYRKIDIETDQIDISRSEEYYIRMNFMF
jgi:hypothetical protein